MLSLLSSNAENKDWLLKVEATVADGCSQGVGI